MTSPSIHAGKRATYPAYKPSGVTWLGDVPEHWTLISLRRLLRVSSGDMTSSSDFIDEGYPVYGGNGFRGYFPRWNTEPNTIIVGRYGALCGNVRVTAERTWATEHAFRVLPLAYFDVGFMSRLIEVLDLNRLSARTAQPGLNSEMVRNHGIALPTPDEQEAIAAFLDRETARIDALIEKKRRQIELLQEKRSALISHAVTKGLDPNAPMKDSGIEWIGEVPEHWEVRRLGWLSRVVRGASPRPAGDSRFFHGDFVPWITVAEITGDQCKYLCKTSTMLTEEGRARSRLLESGTLVLTNSGATLGVPKILTIQGCANDGVVAFLDLHPEASKNFLYYCLSSLTAMYRDRIKQGSGQPNLNTDIVKSTEITFPPRAEQQQIVTHIERASEEVNALMAKVASSIEKLHEYRTALIATAVTGRIDVRGEVANG
jgi:type I restriction enzyme S subunit